jgi:hypothetical protein
VTAGGGVLESGADQAITSAIDTHVQGEKRRDEDDEDDAAGALIPAG